MDRSATMLICLAAIVCIVLAVLASFSAFPLYSTCLVCIFFGICYYMADETSGIHHAQEFENRFKTGVAALFTAATVFVRDSPLYFQYKQPWSGFSIVFFMGLIVHIWDRMNHRTEMTRERGLRRGVSASHSLVRLSAMGLSVEDQLREITTSLENIDQLLVPSTVNNVWNQPMVFSNERKIINIFEEAHPKALNWLMSHTQLGLVFYKIKDHRAFRSDHRTKLIELLAVERISVLNVNSRVALLRALQLMKLTANANAEHWVRNIILSTHQDDLSELKTLTDSKGDYFCMNKLIYEDIRSNTVRQDILTHFRKEANVAQAHMDMGTRKARLRMQKAWRKILSDVDDTLTSSGGSYPAGIDKRYTKKVIYPGVIGLYRELDLGITGPDEFPPGTVGNLVFLSARPHLYKDISEKHNFAKFDKLRQRKGVNGRGGLHTIPSLLAGDLTSGREFLMTNDYEPLAKKKFDNFKKYVSIYPEYRHVFVCDNGQGDVRAGELMFDQFPQHLDGLFVHLVQDIQKTYGFDAERWRRKGLMEKTCFFTNYVDAALYAATRNPPFIRMSGLGRVCEDAVADFEMIESKQWSSQAQKRNRCYELNQSLWACNLTLQRFGESVVPLINFPRQWEDGQKVKTSYGIGKIIGFDSVFDLYGVELDWRPLDEQIKEYAEEEALKKDESRGTLRSLGSKITERSPAILQTVVEEDESNYLSPSTSFDASKHSSKQSLAGADQLGLSVPSVVDESCSSPPFKSVANNFVFDADSFDNKNAASPEPSLDETTETLSTVDAPSITKTTHLNKDLTSSRNFAKGKFIAKVQGRNISKFTQPSLPKIKEDKNRSKFSFWSTKGNANANDTIKPKCKATISSGEKVTTPFGVGTVIVHRHNQNILVVDMAGWPARAYLHESVVKREDIGYFGSILRQFSSSGERQLSPKKSTKSKSSADKQFPYEVGTRIITPYGKGTIIRPLPSRDGNKFSNSSRISIPDSSPQQLAALHGSEVCTVAIGLTSWTLRNGSHPTLYCTADSAIEWTDRLETSVSLRHTRENSYFSVIGSIVSGTLDTLKKIRVPHEIEAPTIPSIHKFERYYKDGAAVVTAYGDGTIRSFRESDGFYSVSLLTKSGKEFGVAYLQEDSMSYRLAKSAREGYPVLTKMGLSGVLQSVDPTTGVHKVTVSSCGIVCYLQPDQVIRPLKAAVGEDTSSPFGEGKVLNYRLADDFYEIKIWGNAILYAKAETFDRIDDRMEDRGGFAMGWILNLFYSREERKGDETQRSRSNSISKLSQSGRSISIKSGRSGT